MISYCTSIYIGDLVAERHTFSDLVEGLSTPCTCDMSRSPWNTESNTQVTQMHILCKIHMYISFRVSCAASGVYLQLIPAQENLVKFSCVHNSLSGEPEVCLIYIVHFLYTLYYLYRPVHSFTCAGMLPVQYSTFSQFAELRVLGTSYISRSMQCYNIVFSENDFITNVYRS